MHLFFDLIAKGAICDIQLIRLLEKLILLCAELEQKVTSRRPLFVFYSCSLFTLQISRTISKLCVNKQPIVANGHRSMLMMT